jgi:urease accessory protein
MVTGARTAMNMSTLPMNTSANTLTLVQLLSPSFPVGAFAYSHGLENAIDDGLIANAEDLQDWLHCLLTQGGGRADAVLLNLALVADEQDVSMIDAHARAFAASKERIQETNLQGSAFCETVTAVWGIPLSKLTYPVAVGRAARALNLDPDLTTAMYLQAFVGNLCGAAMRLVPLGQTDGQRVQVALKPVMIDVAATVKDATLDDFHSNTFMSDIAAMRHETQYSRVFRT